MEVRASTVAEHATAIAWLFREGAQAEQFLGLIANGGFNSADLLVAVEGNALRGAMIAQPLPGRLAVVVPPAAEDDSTADALVRYALAHLASRGTRLAQCYLESGTEAAALERHCFRRVTQIEIRRLSLAGRASDGCPSLNDGTRRWRVRLTDRFDPTLFGATLLPTYDGSLDAPEANIGAAADEILAGYSRTGRRWLATLDGAPVGVLLVAENGRAGEIEYFGVVPAARGRGIGAAILKHALEHFISRRLDFVTVAVDVRNYPARELYARLDFQPFHIQDLLLRGMN